jgi:hypothetical protein
VVSVEPEWLFGSQEVCPEVRDSFGYLDAVRKGKFDCVLWEMRLRCGKLFARQSLLAAYQIAAVHSKEKGEVRQQSVLVVPTQSGSIWMNIIRGFEAEKAIASLT